MRVADAFWKVRLCSLAGLFFVLAVGLCGCGEVQKGEGFVFVRDTSAVRGVWLSRRLDALWLRKTASGEWRVGERWDADAGKVHSLLELLGALRCDVALSAEGADSLRKGLGGDGLQVCLEYSKGTSDVYSLFLPSGKRPCVYSEAKRQAWTMDVLGFDENFIANLSLLGSDWKRFALGVSRPSDLRAVQLLWKGDSLNSFSMQVGDGYAMRVVSLANRALPVECDTALVSVFLHSLTSLRSYALREGELDSLRAPLDFGHFACQLSLLLQTGDTLCYTIAAAPSAVQEDAVSNVGYLQTKDGEIRRIALTDWDVTLLPLSDLLLF